MSETEVLYWRLWLSEFVKLILPWTAILLPVVGLAIWAAVRGRRKADDQFAFLGWQQVLICAGSIAFLLGALFLCYAIYYDFFWFHAWMNDFCGDRIVQNYLTLQASRPHAKTPSFLQFACVDYRIPRPIPWPLSSIAVIVGAYFIGLWGNPFRRSGEPEQSHEAVTD